MIYDFVEIPPAAEREMNDTQLHAIAHWTFRHDRQFRDTELQEGVVLLTALCRAQQRHFAKYFSTEAPNDRIGLHVHGEYGFMTVQELNDKSTPTIYISTSYVDAVRDMKLKARATKLARDMITVGFPMYALLQWFDSMYRLDNGRRTSPHFKPVAAFDKLAFVVEPAIDMLLRKSTTYVELQPQEI